MEKYYYDCDGGGLLLGNKDFRCVYMNNYGDGCHTVYIKKKKETQFPKLNHNKSFYDVYHFEGSVKGTFNVYNYDCISDKEIENKENIIITLTGKWGVYSFKHSGDMLLECWE